LSTYTTGILNALTNVKKTDNLMLGKRLLSEASNHLLDVIFGLATLFIVTLL